MKSYGVTLDIFCGGDIATFLAEVDLVWVARHYLELFGLFVFAFLFGR